MISNCYLQLTTDTHMHWWCQSRAANDNTRDSGIEGLPCKSVSERSPIFEQLLTSKGGDTGSTEGGSHTPSDAADRQTCPPTQNAQQYTHQRDAQRPPRPSRTTSATNTRYSARRSTTQDPVRRRDARYRDDANTQQPSNPRSWAAQEEAHGSATNSASTARSTKQNPLRGRATPDADSGETKQTSNPRRRTTKGKARDEATGSLPRRRAIAPGRHQRDQLTKKRRRIPLSARCSTTYLIQRAVRRLPLSRQKIARRKRKTPRACSRHHPRRDDRRASMIWPGIRPRDRILQILSLRPPQVSPPGR